MPILVLTTWSPLSTCIDSQEVAEKCTGRPYAHFTWPPLMLTSCIRIAQYHDQETHTGTMHRVHLDSTSYTRPHSCACTRTHVRVHMYACLCTCLCAVCMSVHMYVCAHMCMCVRACTYACHHMRSPLLDFEREHLSCHYILGATSTQ